MGEFMRTIGSHQMLLVVSDDVEEVSCSACLIELSAIKVVNGRAMDIFTET